MPFTRSAGFASALPIVAAMDAAMIFSGRPSRDSAPFEASCILERNRSTFRCRRSWRWEDGLVLEELVGAHPDARIDDLAEHARAHTTSQAADAFCAGHLHTD